MATLSEWKDTIYTAIAWHLPRRLVYWCAVRVCAHSGQGPYATDIAPGVTVQDVLRRWRK